MGLTCQYTLLFSAGNSTLGISQVTWKRGGGKIKHLCLDVFPLWLPSACTHLTLVVNWTPVLMTSGRSGCMGIQGCLSTTNALQWQTNINDPVSLHYIVYTRVSDFKPLHKVAEQVYDLLLQSWAVLNNRISFVGDLLLKFLQFLDLLSYLQLWLSQRGDPEKQRFEKYKPIHKKVRFKSRFGCERTVYHVSKRSRQMFGGPPMQAICCLLFQSASSSSVRFFCTKSMADSSPAISVTICCKTDFFFLNFWLLGYQCECNERLTGRYFQNPRSQHCILWLDCVSHPPQLIQSAQHLLQLRHLLPGGCCLAVSIQVLGQL